MTTFSDQAAKTVFAAPNSASGQPAFRLLTQNDLGLLPASAITAQTANLTNTEVYFSSPFKIPANTLISGNSFRITVGGDNLINPDNNFLIHFKFGPNGNISDNSVMDDNGNNGYYCRWSCVATVRGTGNNATLVFMMLHPPEQPTSFTIIDTTVDNYLGISANKAPVGNLNFDIMIIEQLK